MGVSILLLFRNKFCKIIFYYHSMFSIVSIYGINETSLLNALSISLQKNMFKAMTKNQKDEIRRILDFVQNTLEPQWAEWEGFQEFKRRADELRELLDQDGNAKDRGKY